ncbi:LacI family DNA-binding transcriptional regulator [Sagittula sp. NFXS13]|uniref:LacI family DNA-binding transcriptional regulator n=1 Tax=Sagittula sp. NFXS13 TaxID=2819095 RepID=UPI0032DF0F7D
MMDSKIATIQDVARVAGVSTATVSRTISKPDVVAKATREAVLSAVAETGYRVNTTASNLRRQRTGTVLVLLPNIANPFFSQILAGLASVLTPAEYSMLIADTQTGPDADQRLTHYLTSGQADGLVVLDGTLSPETLSGPLVPPAVLVCEWMGSTLPSVRVENARGAALAVNHLADLGHSRIGHVTGPPGNVLTETRRDGFCRALADRGLPVHDDWILEGDFTMDSGAAAARAWCHLEDRPTALFLSSDEMAIGCMGALQSRGIRVPEDVSIVGFDNIEIAQHLSPGLTTIRQPRTDIGVRAAEILMDMIASKTKDGQSEIITVHLIPRGSTGPAPE